MHYRVIDFRKGDAKAKELAEMQKTLNRKRQDSLFSAAFINQGNLRGLMTAAMIREAYTMHTSNYLKGFSAIVTAVKCCKLGRCEDAKAWFTLAKNCYKASMSGMRTLRIPARNAYRRQKTKQKTARGENVSMN